MSNILIEKDSKGRKIYRGLLSSKETEAADLLLALLEEEIPTKETELKDKYGSSVMYKYYLGRYLGDYLREYNISEIERRYFWDEIKNFASKDERKRSEGSLSKTRSFFEQCYILSLIEEEAVKNLSWRQWQDLLDRTANRVDERIYSWIKKHEIKIKEDEWRSFEKALNVYLKNKDTSVFSDDELFELYESILLMAQIWLSAFAMFAKDKPKSAKIKSKGKWETKYYNLCFSIKKEKKLDFVDEKICIAAFHQLFNS